METYDQEADISYFEQNRDLLHAKYGDRVAVIHNQEAVEFFDTEMEALRFAVKKYGWGRFIIQDLIHQCFHILSAFRKYNQKTVTITD